MIAYQRFWQRKRTSGLGARGVLHVHVCVSGLLSRWSLSAWHPVVVTLAQRVALERKSDTKQCMVVFGPKFKRKWMFMSSSQPRNDFLCYCSIILSARCTLNHDDITENLTYVAQGLLILILFYLSQRELNFTPHLWVKLLFDTHRLKGLFPRMQLFINSPTFLFFVHIFHLARCR